MVLVYTLPCVRHLGDKIRTGRHGAVYCVFVYARRYISAYMLNATVVVVVSLIKRQYTMSESGTHITMRHGLSVGWHCKTGIGLD